MWLHSNPNNSLRFINANDTKVIKIHLYEDYYSGYIFFLVTLSWFNIVTRDRVTHDIIVATDGLVPFGTKPSAATMMSFVECTFSSCALQEECFIVWTHWFYMTTSLWLVLFHSLKFNSLWPSDTSWCDISFASWVVMACLIWLVSNRHIKIIFQFRFKQKLYFYTNSNQ